MKDFLHTYFEAFQLHIVIAAVQFSPRPWRPGIPHRTSPAHCQSLETIWSAAWATAWRIGYNCSHTSSYSRWPCSLSTRAIFQVVKSCTTIPDPHKAMWCPKKLYSGPKQDCPSTRAAIPDSKSRFVLSGSDDINERRKQWGWWSGHRTYIPHTLREVIAVWEWEWARMDVMIIVYEANMGMVIAVLLHWHQLTGSRIQIKQNISQLV